MGLLGPIGLRASSSCPIVSLSERSHTASAKFLAIFFIVLTSSEPLVACRNCACLQHCTILPYLQKLTILLRHILMNNRAVSDIGRLQTLKFRILAL